MIALLLLLVVAQASAAAAAGVRCVQRNNSSSCGELSFCAWQQQQTQCVALCANLNSFPALCVDNKCDYVNEECISPKFQQELPPHQQDVFCYRYDLEQDCLKWPQKCLWSEETRSCGLLTKQEEPGVPGANLPKVTLAPSSQESVSTTKCHEIQDSALCVKETKCEYVNMLCQPILASSPSPTTTTTTVPTAIELSYREFDIDLDYWTVVCSAVVIAASGTWLALAAHKRRSFSRLYMVRMLQLALLCVALAFFFLADGEADYVLIGFTAYATALLLTQCMLRVRLSRFAMEAGLFLCVFSISRHKSNAFTQHDAICGGADRCPLPTPAIRRNHARIRLRSVTHFCIFSLLPTGRARMVNERVW